MKHNSIAAGSRSIEYEIIHRPAVTRRIHLELDANGGLQVVAPRRMSKKTIHSTLQCRAGHVVRFLERARERQKDIRPLDYINGEFHFYMGQKIPLEVISTPGKRAWIERIGCRIRVCTPQIDRERVKSRLLQWYREQAHQHFLQRLTWFTRLAAWTDGRVPEMRLRRMKRTWGSCSAKGVITLNPHLVKAPMECIDYVIAHEVCHLRELNHGKAFYALQAELFPGWREARSVLRNKGHIYLHQ